jgi:hypothetical protein
MAPPQVVFRGGFTPKLPFLTEGWWNSVVGIATPRPYRREVDACSYVVPILGGQQEVEVTGSIVLAFTDDDTGVVGGFDNATTDTVKTPFTFVVWRAFRECDGH